MTDVIEELVVKESGYLYRYSFDKHVFYNNWRHGPDEGTSSIPLNQLSRHHTLTQGRPDGFTRKFQIAGAFIAGAIIVYFSDFNHSIPLLAPALFIYGAGRTVCMWSDVLPKKWTIIRYNNGEQASSIVHNNSDKERIKFETALSQAIDDAKDISS
ncbi:MAG: hypothetical protein DRR06_17305 [Gammaproteobacteria bacterium]|nr:MAG: hypothetical protein DRR06_17305 [Gammaproteobacteria bacterium]